MNDNPFANVIMMQSNTHPKLARRVADKLEIEWNPLTIHRFGQDGCTLPKFEKSVRGKTVLVLETQTPPVNDNFIITQQIVRAATGNGAAKVFVIMPNYFYQRTEKDDQVHSCDFASVVYDTLKREGMNGLYTADLHNNAITGYKEGSVFIFNMSMMYKFVEAIKNEGLDNYVVGVPDSDIKLAENLAGRLNYIGPLLFFPKIRPDNTGKAIYGDPVGKIAEGQDVILIDDESLTGGTVVSAGEKLKKTGKVRDIYLFLARVWPDDNLVSKLSRADYKKIYITDSTPFPKSILTEKFEVLSTVDLYVEAIKSLILQKSFPREYKFSMK